MNQSLTKIFELTLASVCLITGDHFIKVYLIQDQVWDQITLRILATIYTAHNLKYQSIFSMHGMHFDFEFHCRVKVNPNLNFCQG